MPVYARVVDGSVVEVFSPPEGFTLDQVFHPDIAALFVAAPDDVEVGWCYDGKTFSAPEPVQLSPADQARDALAAGINIVSKKHPEINGTYSLDIGAQLQLVLCALTITAEGNFPGGRELYSRLDTSGELHTFSSGELFLAWALAIAHYVGALDQIIQTGEGDLPEQPVEIP